LHQLKYNFRLKAAGHSSEPCKVHLIVQIAPLFVLLATAFGCGYGVREYIARRKRAAARKKFYDENPDLRQLRGL
jgi:hypothetical protein